MLNSASTIICIIGKLMTKRMTDSFPIIKGVKSTFLKNCENIGKLNCENGINAKFPMLIASRIVSQYFSFTD